MILIFKSTDVDSDGLLSQNEFKEFMVKLSKRREIISLFKL
jgi:hypothetical protein